jgi:hypothetical protein
MRLVTPPETVPKTRTAPLLLFGPEEPLVAVPLLEIVIVASPESSRDPMLLVPAPPLLIPTVLVTPTLVNCAMAFEFGTTEEVAPFVSQLLVVNHAPPLMPRQTNVSCALASYATPNNTANTTQTQPSATARAQRRGRLRGLAGRRRSMSLDNQRVSVARGKACDVKIKSHCSGKVGTPANPHEYWIHRFLLMLQKQLFCHVEIKKAWSVEREGKDET